MKASDIGTIMMSLMLFVGCNKDNAARMLQQFSERRHGQPAELGPPQQFLLTSKRVQLCRVSLCEGLVVSAGT